MRKYAVLLGVALATGILDVSVVRGDSAPSIKVDFPRIQTPFTTAGVDTFVLAHFSFDTAGNCTTEAWQEQDLTTGYGSFAGLFSGVNTVQEDPCFNRFGCLWGFFEDSPFDFACDNLPQQAAVPFGNLQGLYISNEIWSPEIPIIGSGSTFILRFFVYRDLPLENLVFYSYRIRSVVGGVPGPWRSAGVNYYGIGKDWMQVGIQVGPLIEPGATGVQIALGCHDLCGIWCGILGDGSCHSHAPLFDNVALLRVDNHRPNWMVRDIDLFQDNFSSDGTITGTVRADAALDILPRTDPGIRPADSVCVTVSAFEAGLDHHIAGDASSGPAVYCHVGNVGTEKLGTAVSGDLARWPLVSAANDWSVLRMDSAFAPAGAPVSDRFCVDLNDNLYTPGDTIWYFFSARGTDGHTSYWSRAENGQGPGFTTSDLAAAVASPMEFTCLPAGGWKRGGDILYVDDADDETGAPQFFFDTAFDMLGIRDLVDRYDVLGASSLVGNGPGSRIADVAQQVLPQYRVIIWNSGSLTSGLIGDGTGRPEKSDDFNLLHSLLDQVNNNPGVYISGDNVASEWADLAGIDAGDFRNTYMNFLLVTDRHLSVGENMSPQLTGVGTIFAHLGILDELVALGGCPTINNFDVLAPMGRSVPELNSGHGNTFVLSQETPNSVQSTARVVLSGFSYHAIRDRNAPGRIPARVEHLRDILVSFSPIPVPCPTRVCQINQASVTPLGLVIELKWDPGTCANAEKFNIYRTRGDGDSLLVATLPPGAVRFTDGTALPGVTYEYVLGAVLPGSFAPPCAYPRSEWRMSLGFGSIRPRIVYKLRQNFPNPFNPTTIIEYWLERREHVSLKVYNSSGQLVRTLVNEEKGATAHRAEWDGTDNSGKSVASGVYFYRLVTGNFEQTKKMVVIH